MVNYEKFCLQLTSETSSLNETMWWIVLSDTNVTRGTIFQAPQIVS